MCGRFPSEGAASMAVKGLIASDLSFSVLDFWGFVLFILPRLKKAKCLLLHSLDTLHYISCGLANK